MAHLLRLPIALTLVIVVLAGCAGKNDNAGAAPPANFDDLGLEATATTGIIRGVVVDDAVRPLAAVDVSVALPDGALRNTKSAADGAFGFDGLQPGTYFLKANKTGYLSVQASTDVLAGVKEPPIVKLLLKIDVAALPYVAAYKYDGFVACSFTLVIVSFAACGLAEDQTNNEFLVEYEADKPPQWIQSEAIWDSTQALGGELGLSLTDFSTGVQIGVNGTAGPSPIYFTVNETTALQFNYGINNTLVIRLFSSQLTGTDVVPEEQVHAVWKSTLYGPVNSTGVPALYQSTVVDNDPTGYAVNPFGNPECVNYPVLFNACLRVGGVGMAIEQQVTVFTHIFYGYTPPAGWRFSASGDAPPPPV